jgi:hypothetical protein
MQSPKPEFPGLVAQPSAEWGNARRMSSAIRNNAPAKSISDNESFAEQLANDEAAHQQWLEKVQKLRLTCRAEI